MWQLDWASLHAESVAGGMKVHRIACRKHILGRLGGMAAPARREMCMYILQHLSSLHAQDAGVISMLRVSPFVDTKSGSLQPPSNLHDPR